MENNCQKIHAWASSLKRFYFPFESTGIPQNGIYFLFEKGEKCYGVDRIVRIGTHTGANQLQSRLKQHFLVENKDRSIFRKNIGRAFLNKDNDDFLTMWEIDCTSREVREKYKNIIDVQKQAEVEKKVSKYIQGNFSFSVISIEDKDERLSLESKIISTVSLCDDCGASSAWLGKYSPKEKIRESSLWLVNELYKEPLSPKEIEVLIKKSY